MVIKLDTLKRGLDKILELILMVLFLAMVLVALWGIFSRIILQNQSSFTTEFLTYTLLWTSLVAASYCFGKRSHLSITFLKDKMNCTIKKIIDILTELIIIFFAVSILIFGGIQGFSMGVHEIVPTLKIPISYIYVIFPVSGVFIAFYSLNNLLIHLKKGEE